MQAFNLSYDRQHRRLVLVGPPGTGKTRTALDAFIEPALQANVPQRVLACSFSNAAADELRARLGDGYWLRESVSTIHSEALRRVKTDSLRLYDPATDTVKIFRRGCDAEALAPMPGCNDAAIAAWDLTRALLIHDDEKSLDGWCAHFARQHNTTRREVRDRIAYFEQRKREECAVDFTDMLMLALRAPGRSSGLALLLVDEAQDCTPLQWALIDHWSRSADQVVLIGDPDQTIHEWMGASYTKLLHRIRSQDWQTRALVQSYRVPVRAHSVARSIVARISDREDAAYAPTPTLGCLSYCSEDDVIRRAREVARAYVDAPERQTADCTVESAETPSMFILARTNRDVLRLRARLAVAGVPYCSEDPGTPVSFAPATARRARTIIDLFAGEPVQADAVKDALSHVPAKGWFTGQKSALLASIPDTGTITITALPWFNKAAGVAATLDAMEISSYWLAVARTYGSWVLTSPAPVRVLTMHRSKGREADVVAVCKEKAPAVMYNGVGDDELRLLYVAVTRTRDELMLFSRAGFNVYEELRHDGVPF